MTQSCQEMNGLLPIIDEGIDALFLPLPGDETATAARMAKPRGTRGHIVTVATDFTFSHDK